MVGCGWKLLLSKNQQLVGAALAFLQQQPVLQQVLQQPQESPFSVKRVFGSLLFEGVPLEPVEQLMQKILEEERQLADENTCLASLAWLLVGLSLKAHVPISLCSFGPRSTRQSSQASSASSTLSSSRPITSPQRFPKPTSPRS